MDNERIEVTSGPVMVNGRPVDYSKVPVAQMRESIMLWIERGQCYGDFLTAFIKNDLREAAGRADSQNLANLGNLVTWFYKNAPSRCWGSPVAFERWQHQMENQR